MSASDNSPPSEKTADGGKNVVVKPEELPEALRVQLGEILKASPQASVRVGFTATQQQTIFSGPVPDPGALMRYELIEKGLASRLVAMAEKNGEHLREQEKTKLRGRIVEELLGQTYGFLIALAFLGIGAYLVMQGHDGAGAFTSTAGVATLAGIFVYGRRGRAAKVAPAASNNTPIAKPKRPKGKR